MGKITVRSPFSIGNDTWGSSLVFNKWLPEGEQAALVKIGSKFTSRLWIDRTCISAVSEYDLSKWVNITVNQVYIDVETDNVSDGLVQFIYDERKSPFGIHYGIQPEQPEYSELSKIYTTLGKEIFSAALEIYNRLMAFSRASKGQYWLQDRVWDDDHWPILESLVRSETYDWVCWCPPGIQTIVFDLPGDERYLTQEDWSKAQEFVEKNSRTNFVLELLANAESFVSSDLRRNAIVEAMAALELAVNKFAQSPQIEIQEKRLDKQSLASQVEHLGFSATMRYLLPLLFPDNSFPSNTFKQCWRLIDVRNNIIHNGQREVGLDQARSLVRAAREACEILIAHTAEE